MTEANPRTRSTWFGRSREHAVELRRGGLDETGMRDPRAVEPTGRLPDLVLGHLRERAFVRLGIAAARDVRRHPAHRVRAAPMAGPHEELGVRAHERHRHRDLRAIGQDERRVAPELLDHAEDVVPTSGVQPRCVVAELVEDLVHLERREDRLDQDRGADRSAFDPEPVLRPPEDVVPQARLEMALELREVEVRTGASLELLAGVVEEREPEVEEAAGDRSPVHEHVPLRQLPPARPNDQRRDAFAQPVLAAVGRGQLDRPADRVGEVHLTVDHVRPRRRGGVLEIGHEAARARVQCVDHHLAIGGTRDLDAAIEEVGRRGSHAPIGIARSSGSPRGSRGVRPRRGAAGAPHGRRADPCVELRTPGAARRRRRARRA